MTANKRLTDLTDYTSVLPYASELFGVYQPLLGWRSKRMVNRIQAGAIGDAQSTLLDLVRMYRGNAQVTFNVDHMLQGAQIGIGRLADLIVRPTAGSLLLAQLADELNSAGAIPKEDEWQRFVNQDRLTQLLNTAVFDAYRIDYQRRFTEASRAVGGRQDALESEFVAQLQRESAMAGMLQDLASNKHYDALSRLFFATRPGRDTLERALAALANQYQDPYLTFDPTKQIKDVSLSPVGIVHLFRQFFFELDSFVGTPVGHVWLSPGSMVELIEVSTRKTLVEKTIETVLETTTKTEKSTTNQDEISDAVKQDNKDDMKLGFSATVNQSWGTGNATATGTLNMDKTQETAREQGHKRMRQQSEKLSTEIRQSFKSTFRTVTETIDTSSKRYVLNNTTADLINYELRRKMRQVGVQIQDVGSYLCWETFVDNPGSQLALPNLIHIAKPADLVLVPNPNLLPMPPSSVSVAFSGEAVWNFPDNTPQHQEDHPETGGQFVPIATLDIPGIPTDYEVAYDPSNPYLAVEKSVTAAKDDSSWNAVNWGFKGMITPDAKRVMVGVTTMPKPKGLAWDDRITFSVSGAVTCRLSAAKQDEISKANDALISAKLAADQENQRKLEQAYLDSVRERVTLASKITRRKFEDLREEERTIVYRNLIKALLTEQLYRDTPDTPSGLQTRHVLSELINAIFDIEKMLYFVAPEWWKPRRTATLTLGGSAIQDSINGSVVRWAEDQEHGKYFITDEANPAAMGSSLGWLLQLDGDDLRNAFLNAPWVKAVIPIRPGKEQAAINWLKNVGVEGSDGLDAAYAAPDDELKAIRTELLAHDANDPVKDHVDVTVDDAIRDLCIRVADKYAASNVVGRYPKDEINDDNKVSATPIEKVYEHGFYPLVGGFKAKTEEPFEICSQWIEVLPTDQVVPIEVKYNPKTGRQV
jgi:hypothetical protein